MPMLQLMFVLSSHVRCLLRISPSTSRYTKNLIFKIKKAANAGAHASDLPEQALSRSGVAHTLLSPWCGCPCWPISKSLLYRGIPDAQAIPAAKGEAAPPPTNQSSGIQLSAARRGARAFQSCYCCCCGCLRSFWIWWVGLAFAQYVPLRCIVKLL